MISKINGQFQKALNLFNSKEFDKSKNILKNILASHPEHFNSIQTMGIILSLQKQFNDAEVFFKKALTLKPNDANLNFNLAKCLSDQKKEKEALHYHEIANRLSPSNLNILTNYGKSFFNLNDFVNAIKFFQKTININNSFIEGWINIGVTLQAMNENDKSIQFFENALKIDKNNFIAWNYLGVSLMRLKKFEVAHKCFSNSINLNSNFSESFLNKGLIYFLLGDYQNADINFDKGLSLDPNSVFGLHSKANSLNAQKKYLEAIKYYENALKIDLYRPLLLSNLIHTKMLINDWHDLLEYKKILKSNIVSGKIVSTPFSILSLFDDPKLHQQNALKYMNSQYPIKNPNNIKNNKVTDKIKIAYFSGDFHDHPVSQLMINVFERHNNFKFEVYAFSYGPKKNDNMRKKIQSSVNKFLDVENLSDLEISNLSKNLKIDIAVDLAGHTNNSRIGIFSNFCAPIQISYLGYPSTTGSNYFDYLLSDNVIIPEEQKENYTEKIVYFKDCYLPIKNKITKKENLKKSDFGLDDDKFVYCCFNNSYKLLPNTLNIWIQVLKRNQNSLLWLSEINPINRKNLQNFFYHNGINEKQLVFAKRVEKIEDHLMRYHVADLFLDTFPYNGHVTTLDALSAFLPVITKTGKSYASRASASILKFMSLDYLITRNEDEYLEKINILSNDPNKLFEIKGKISSFYSKNIDEMHHLFTRDLESIYENILNK